MFKHLTKTIVKHSLVKTLLAKERSKSAAWKNKPSDWFDIRTDCPDNSIALYAGTSIEGTASLTNVGSPTISNGVISGFSSSNYAKASSLPDFSGDCEIVIPFNVADLSSTQYLMSWIVSGFSCGIKITTQGKIDIYFSRSGDSSTALSIAGNHTYSTNTNNKMKLVKEGNTLSLYYWDNGWVFDKSSTNENAGTITVASYFRIGVSPSYNPQSPLNGSIDLKGTYIKTGNEYFLAPYYVNTYDNLGFTATCTGGYNVFIDEVQFGTTYASGATCSITWSTSGITTGDIITTPELLKAHKIWIEPATSGNNITAFHCARVASSGTEEQGILWAHFNVDNQVNLSEAFYSADYKNELLESITALDNELSISSLYYAFNSTALEYIPDLIFPNSFGSYLSGAFAGTKITKITLKDTSFTDISQAFKDCKALKKIIFKDVDFSSLTNADKFITNAKDLSIDLDFSTATGLTILGCFGEASYFVESLKGLRVSSLAPFNNSSTPQINVSYTGLDRSALVQLFNDLPTVTDSQTLSCVGCTGTADLTADDKAIATDKGWTLILQ